MSISDLRPDRRLVYGPIFLGLLACLYLVGLFVGHPAAESLFLPGFSPAGVDSISLSQGGARLELRQGKGGWEVMIDGAPYPADRARIEGMLAALRTIAVVRTASRSQADWSAFGLDQSMAVRILAQKGNERAADLLAGSTDASGGGLYVRRSGATAVEEITPELARYLVLDPSYWSQLKILPASFTVASLQSIAVEARGFSVGGTTVNESYLLEAGVAGGATQWKLHGGPQVTLNQQKVLDMEAELVTMVGDQFAASVSPEAAGLTSPTASVTLSNEQGQSVSLLVGKREGSRFYVRCTDAPYIYLVNQYSLQRAIPPRASLEGR